MRVLHVCEVMGGGIVSSILAMVEATPGVDHHIAVWPRRDHGATGDDWPKAFSSANELPPGLLRAVVALRRGVRELFPDIVHAHSSYAGILARVAGLDRSRVVYSPHCFAGERRNVGALERRGADLLERSLVPMTRTVAGVAPYELTLARAIGHDGLAYIPNRALCPPRAVARFAAPMHVVTAGRITAQKDWRYLLHVKRYAEQELGVEATWEWLGGGDPGAEAVLTEAGVRVSGWIPRDELLRRLSRAQVYLHTAAWEAAPISILEAAAFGVPLAVRAIAPIASLGVPGAATSPAALALRVAGLQDPTTWRAARQASVELASTHSRTAQARALYDLYESVSGQSARPQPVTRVLPSPVGSRVTGRSA